MFFGKSKGQGTIEYLVILAVIVVVSLIVVSLMINSTSGAEGISSGTSKIGGWTNTISVTESAISPDGNYLVRLANNTGEPVTIKTVKIGDQDVNYSEDLFQGNQQNFKITSDMVCELGQTVVGELVVTYVSQNGLEHTEVFPADITFECNDYIVNLLADQCPEVGEGGCTLTGDAVEGDVLYSKTFYSNDSEMLLIGDLNLVESHSGQTSCYDDVSQQPCPVTGFEEQDANNDGIPKSYTDNADETVTDNHTGLMWQKDGSSGTMTWATAISTCASATTGGKSDWRVPSNVELITFADFNCSGFKAAPSSSNCLQRYVNIAFEATNLWDGSTGSVYGYWSSTTVPSDTSNAYYLASSNGNIDDNGKTYDDIYGVRCVRSE